jgi:hypothetical protein
MAERERDAEHRDAAPEQGGGGLDTGGADDSAVLAAMEYAGALPATAMSVDPALVTPPACSACCS